MHNNTAIQKVMQGNTWLSLLTQWTFTDVHKLINSHLVTRLTKTAAARVENTTEQTHSRHGLRCFLTLQLSRISPVLELRECASSPSTALPHNQCQLREPEPAEDPAMQSPAPCRSDPHAPLPQPSTEARSAPRPQKALGRSWTSEVWPLLHSSTQVLLHF